MTPGETDQDLLSHFLPPPIPAPTQLQAIASTESTAIKTQLNRGIAPTHKLGEVTQKDLSDEDRPSTERSNKNPSLYMPYASKREKHPRSDTLSGYQALANPQDSPKIHEDGAAKYLKKKCFSKTKNFAPKVAKQILAPHISKKLEFINDLSKKYQKDVPVQEKKVYDAVHNVDSSTEEDIVVEDENFSDRIPQTSDDSFRGKVILNFEELGVSSAFENPKDKHNTTDTADQAVSNTMEPEQMKKESLGIDYGSLPIPDSESSGSFASQSISTIFLHSTADEVVEPKLMNTEELKFQLQNMHILNEDKPMPLEDDICENAILMNELEELKLINNELKEENNSNEETIYQLQEELICAKHDVAKQVEIAHVMEETHRKTGVKINQFRQQIQHFKIEKEELERKVQQLLDNNIAAEQAVEHLERQVSHLAGMNAAKENSKMEKLSAENQDLHQEVKEVMEMKNECEKKKSELEMKLKQSTLVQKWQEEELEVANGWKEEQEKMEEKLTAAEQLIDTLKFEAEQNKNKYDTVQQEADADKRCLEEKKELNKKNIDLLCQNEEDQQSIQALKHEINLIRLHQQVQAKQILQEKEKTEKEQRKTTNDLKEKLADSEMNNAMLKDQILDLEFSCEQLVNDIQCCTKQEKPKLRASSSCSCLAEQPDSNEETFFNPPVPTRPIIYLEKDELPMHSTNMAEAVADDEDGCIEKLQVALTQFILQYEPVCAKELKKIQCTCTFETRDVKTINACCHYFLHF